MGFPVRRRINRCPRKIIMHKARSRCLLCRLIRTNHGRRHRLRRRPISHRPRSRCLLRRLIRISHGRRLRLRHRPISRRAGSRCPRSRCLQYLLFRPCLPWYRHSLRYPLYRPHHRRRRLTRITGRRARVRSKRKRTAIVSPFMRINGRDALNRAGLPQDFAGMSALRPGLMGAVRVPLGACLKTICRRWGRGPWRPFFRRMKYEQ